MREIKRYKIATIYPSHPVADCVLSEFFWYKKKKYVPLDVIGKYSLGSITFEYDFSDPESQSYS